jgi:predicted DCC family thiol-disulfide oxidoreductase YuxK
MVYDGNCHFCTFWVRRWKRSTGDRVDYLPFQEPVLAARFPEIPREAFETSVQLIETNRQVYNGAEAAFRALACNPRKGRLLWLYEKAPGFALFSEWAYRFVARHRTAFSKLTKWIWGSERDNGPRSTDH